MFVVDVCTLRRAVALRMSAGSPDCASVMATNDAQVSARVVAQVVRRGEPRADACRDRNEHQQRDERRDQT